MRLPGVSHRIALQHPNLSVTDHQQTPKKKERMLHCVGNIAPEVNLRVNNPDIHTLEAALLTRMLMCEVNGEFVEPPLPTANMVEQRLSDFKSRLGYVTATPNTLEQVVESYSGRKRSIYERACASLARKPLSRRDSVSVAFVKPEKVPPNKAPRCIQPRDPRYNLHVGRYLKHVEHRLYKRIARVFGDGPTVMKGYNVEQIANIMHGKWKSFSRPVAVGLDATKFDMHVSPAMLSWEHSIYLSMYKNCPELRKLLEWQMDNQGVGYCHDGKLKYRVRGKRFSGDMNTALGNCLIMCAMVHAYSRERGVCTKLVNNGDDCVVFMESRDLVRFQEGLEEWFLDLGFRMVAEPPVYHLQQVEFCQMHPIRTSQGSWKMVRNIPKAMAKDAMCLIPLRTKGEFENWIGAVGQCGSSLAGDIPVLSSFYKCYSRNGCVTNKFGEEIIARSGYAYYGKGVEAKGEVGELSRYDVWMAWGIYPDHQVAIEGELNQTTLEYGDQVVLDHSMYPHRTL